MKNREINNNEKCACMEVNPKTTLEDELHWARVRNEELRIERDGLIKKVESKEKTIQTLIDCLSAEHNQQVIANNQLEWCGKRNDTYRTAISEIAKKCHEVLKEDSKSEPKTVEQLAKEIWDITYRF
jgi:hypothetical protein